MNTNTLHTDASVTVNQEYSYEATFYQNRDPLDKNYWSSITQQLRQHYPHLFELPSPDVLKPIEESAQALLNTACKYVVIVAVGGAVLNSKAILSYINGRTTSGIAGNIPIANFRWLHDLCDLSINELLSSIEPAHTLFLFISNSGRTMEVLALASHLWQEISDVDGAASRVLCITGDDQSELAYWGRSVGAMIIPYDSRFGGRFATFTNIVLLPLLLAGYDPKEFCEGGEAVVQRLSINAGDNEVVRGANDMADLHSSGYRTALNVSYFSRFSGLSHWYNTVLAETFGRPDLGVVNTAGSLPLEQHAQMQLYLGDSKHKFVNFFAINEDMAKLGGVIEVCYEETVKSLQEAAVPMRCFRCASSSLRSIGALVMHLTLESALLATHLQIDPLTQPDIDKLKRDISAATYSRLLIA